MLKALPYMVIILLIAIHTYSSVQWGILHERNRKLQDTNKSLAKSAQHIIDEQAKLQQVEDIINKSPSKAIKSPVLMRSLVRLPECSGKAHCPPP